LVDGRTERFGGTVTVTPGTYALVAKLASDSVPLAGKTISFYSSKDGESWAKIGESATDEGGSASVTVNISESAYFKAEFAGDNEYDPSSDTIYVKVQVQAPQPSPAPAPSVPWWIIIVILLALALLASEERE